jgi:plasmid replication initiation protein
MSKEAPKKKNEVVVRNDFNEISMRRWSAKEMDLFIAIVSKVMNKKQDTVTLDTEELREIISEKKNLARWKETVVSVVNKIGELKYHSYTNKAYSLVFPFSKFDVLFEEKKLVVQVSDSFERIVNVILKDGEFTFYELEEFVKIKSTYAKIMYRHLKQWRTVGVAEFEVERFREMLDVPKSYTNGEVTRRVVEQVLKELAPFFDDLKCKVVKGQGRGTPVKSYIFKFKKQTNLPYQENVANAPKIKKAKTKKTNVPKWSEPDYKNETTEDKKLVMEEYKQVRVAILNTKDKDELERLNKKAEELLKQLNNEDKEDETEEFNRLMKESDELLKEFYGEDKK